MHGGWGKEGPRDRDKTRKVPEDASRTLRREVQFSCVFLTPNVMK